MILFPHCNLLVHSKNHDFLKLPVKIFNSFAFIRYQPAIFVRWFWKEPFIMWSWQGPFEWSLKEPFELWLQIWWHVLDRRYSIRKSPRTWCVWCCRKALGKQTSQYTFALALSLELAGFSSVVGILTLQMKVCNADTPRVVTQMWHLTSAISVAEPKHK